LPENPDPGLSSDPQDRDPWHPRRTVVPAAATADGISPRPVIMGQARLPARPGLARLHPLARAGPTSRSHHTNTDQGGGGAQARARSGAGEAGPLSGRDPAARLFGGTAAGPAGPTPWHLEKAAIQTPPRFASGVFAFGPPASPAGWSPERRSGCRGFFRVPDKKSLATIFLIPVTTAVLTAPV